MMRGFFVCENQNKQLFFVHNIGYKVCKKVKPLKKEENKKVATLSNSYHPTSNCGDNGD